MNSREQWGIQNPYIASFLSVQNSGISSVDIFLFISKDLFKSIWMRFILKVTLLLWRFFNCSLADQYTVNRAVKQCCKILFCIKIFMHMHSDNSNDTFHKYKEITLYI